MKAPYNRGMSVFLRLGISALCALWLCATCSASDVLIKPGRLYAVIDSDHLHVLVPAHAVEKLKPFVARAELIYQHIARDAGYEIHGRLTLLLSDDSETHNGFSTTVPIPIVDIDLPPSTQNSFIFAGDEWLERTLTHELTHHISNDREPNPFRRTLERIFGRILPNDILSLVMAYLDIPAHTTMPSFWHEGCAQWAETVYAPEGSPWGGRGRDSLTHMVWRLDAASAAGLPQPADWRITYQRWPYGTQTYLYGIAYLRYLESAYGNQASVWQLIEAQEHRWPFLFNGGPETILGKDHLTMIAEARAELQQEQLAQLALLHTQPVTTSHRLTPDDSVVGTPAWTHDGRLFAALSPPFGKPHFVTVDLRDHHRGQLHSAHDTSWLMGGARSLPDGTLVYTEAHDSGNPWNRSQATIVTPGGVSHQLPQQRLLQADVRLAAAAHRGSRYQYLLAATHLLPASQQELALVTVDLDDGWFNADRTSGWRVVPTQGRPWSPSFRPGHDELAWVETDLAGSRLVIAPLADLTHRTIIATVRGRILQPSWTADGSGLYLCADHSGVANAYWLDLRSPGVLVPVTNTIGGVIACVPSADGRQLAIVDFDSHGPYLAVIPADRSFWPSHLPTITLPFPAPLGGKTQRWVQADTMRIGRVAGAGAGEPTGSSDAPAAGTPAPRWSMPAGPGDVAALSTHPYHGLSEIRPLFWSPTTLVVPTGGYGVYGLAADPLFTHEISASLGAGPLDGHPVGLAGYVYAGWPLDVAALVWRSELGYDHIIQDAFGNRYNYGETDTSAEVRTGYHLAGLQRRQLAYVGIGIDNHHPLDRYTKVYTGLPLQSAPTFRGRERYVEATLAYDDTEFFPTSFTYEDGDRLALNYRHSDYDGGAHGDRVFGLGQRIVTVWPSQSHQLVLAGMLGWGGGTQWATGAFALGGATGVGLPRGYTSTIAVGNYLVGGSGAYRLPLWRPFTGFSTSPFVFRQLVLEGFYDIAKVTNERLGGNGRWYKSTGAELHAQWEFWTALINPGVGVARQLDATKKVTAYLTLQFGL